MKKRNIEFLVKLCNEKKKESLESDTPLIIVGRWNEKSGYAIGRKAKKKEERNTFNTENKIVEQDHAVCYRTQAS
jgi:hypothetical protein